MGSHSPDTKVFIGFDVGYVLVVSCCMALFVILIVSWSCLAVVCCGELVLSDVDLYVDLWRLFVLVCIATSLENDSETLKLHDSQVLPGFIVDFVVRTSGLYAI